MFKLDHFFKKLNKLGIKISNLKIGLMDRKFKTLVLDNLDQFEISITISQNKLANETKIDLKTFLSLCVIENVNIFYVNKKTYFEHLMNVQLKTV